MDKLSKILGSPATIYGWSVAVFFVIFFALPFLNYIDERLAITLSLLSLKFFVAILLVLSILTTLVYWDWFTRNWYINLVVFAVAAIVLVRLYAIQDPLYY